MDEKELNKRAAELMGCEIVRIPVVGMGYIPPKKSPLQKLCEKWAINGEIIWAIAPQDWDPATDDNHARLLKAEIGRLGLESEFEIILARHISGYSQPFTFNGMCLVRPFHFLMATGAQITAAFVATLEAHGAAAGGEAE